MAVNPCSSAALRWSAVAARPGRIAFDDGAADFPDEIADKRGLQEVAAARLSGRNLHGDFAFGFASQCLVDGVEPGRGDVARHVYFGDGGDRRACAARASGGRQEQEPCGEQTNLFHD